MGSLSDYSNCREAMTSLCPQPKNAQGSTITIILQCTPFQEEKFKAENNSSFREEMAMNWL